MINVAAIRMQQFGVQFYQASLTASDIDKLVRFEVLNYGQQNQPPVRGAPPARHPLEGELGPARAPHRVEREGVPAPDHPAEDRRTGAVLRAVPSGPRSAVDSRRRDHLVRREADLRPVGRGRVEGRHPEGARSARGSCAPSTASTGCWRCTRTSTGSGRGIQRSGDHLRPAARGSRRADVRHHQRQAHAAQRLAPGDAVGTAAVSGREPGHRARHRPGAERPRRFAALRRHQAARRGPGTGGAGAARAGAEEAVRDRGLRRRRGRPRTSTTRREKFFVNYFKQIALVFGGAWNGRKYSIKSATALRAFVRVAPDVIRRLDQEHAERGRLPGHRTRHRAVGPPDRRSAVRDRGRLEARGDDRGCAGQGTQARAPVPGGRRNLAHVGLCPTPGESACGDPSPRAASSRGLARRGSRGGPTGTPHAARSRARCARRCRRLNAVSVIPVTDPAPRRGARAGKPAPSRGHAPCDSCLRTPTC